VAAAIQNGRRTGDFNRNKESVNPDGSWWLNHPSENHHLFKNLHRAHLSAEMIHSTLILGKTSKKQLQAF